MSEEEKLPDGVVNIHGKLYHTVTKRVKDFREVAPMSEGWGICTEILELTETHCRAKATIVDPNGMTIATGHAVETRDALSQGMRGSMAEIAETSAVGRCLSFAGFAGTEIASADEMLNRVVDNTLSKVKANRIMTAMVEAADADLPFALLEIWDELTTDQRIYIMNQLDRVNVLKINACLKIAQDAENDKIDPNFIAPAPLKGIPDARHDARKVK